MIRTFRYPLHPTAAQERVLERWLELCQRLYNAALEERRDAWRRCRMSVSRIDQQKGLTQVRADDPEYAALPVEVARSALARLDRAFKAFFRRVKAGEKPGFPRFRAWDRYDSFAFPFVRIQGDRVAVPKLGAVRLHLYRPIKGEPREVQVRRTSGKWYACIVCDLGEAPDKVPVRTAVGIDLGLTALVTTSDGRTFPNPRPGKKAEAHLAALQRALARKVRGSKRRRKMKAAITKAHIYVRNVRLDGQRKLAARLFSEYDLIAHEDLDVRELVQKDGQTLQKSIHDAGWSGLVRCLADRAEKAGRWLVPVDARNTSKACSGCGTLVPKTLRDRVHECPKCGLVLDRDVNAALNVLARGRRAAGLLPAGRVESDLLPQLIG